MSEPSSAVSAVESIERIWAQDIVPALVDYIRIPALSPTFDPDWEALDDVFYGCANYPKCDFTTWNKPIAEPCPKCGRTFLTEKITKRHGRQLICSNEDCDYSRTAELEEATV